MGGYDVGIKRKKFQYKKNEKTFILQSYMVHDTILDVRKWYIRKGEFKRKQENLFTDFEHDKDGEFI